MERPGTAFETPACDGEGGSGTDTDTPDGETSILLPPFYIGLEDITSTTPAATHPSDPHLSAAVATLHTVSTLHTAWRVRNNVAAKEARVARYVAATLDRHTATHPPPPHAPLPWLQACDTLISDIRHHLHTPGSETSAAAHQWGLLSDSIARLLTAMAGDDGAHHPPDGAPLRCLFTLACMAYDPYGSGSGTPPAPLFGSLLSAACGADDVAKVDPLMHLLLSSTLNLDTLRAACLAALREELGSGAGAALLWRTTCTPEADAEELLRCPLPVETTPGAASPLRSLSFAWRTPLSGCLYDPTACPAALLCTTLCPTRLLAAEAAETQHPALYTPQLCIPASLAGLGEAYHPRTKVPAALCGGLGNPHTEGQPLYGVLGVHTAGELRRRFPAWVYDATSHGSGAAPPCMREVPVAPLPGGGAEPGGTPSDARAEWHRIRSYVMRAVSGGGVEGGVAAGPTPAARLFIDLAVLRLCGGEGEGGDGEVAAPTPQADAGRLFALLEVLLRMPWVPAGLLAPPALAWLRGPLLGGVALLGGADPPLPPPPPPHMLRAGGDPASLSIATYNIGGSAPRHAVMSLVRRCDICILTEVHHGSLDWLRDIHSEAETASRSEAEGDEGEGEGDIRNGGGGEDTAEEAKRLLAGLLCERQRFSVFYAAEGCGGGVASATFGPAVVVRHGSALRVVGCRRVALCSGGGSEPCPAAAVTLEAGGRRVALHAVHLHCGEEAVRLEQARAVLRDAAQACPGVPHAICGDFNALVAADYSEAELAAVAAHRLKSSWEAPRFCVSQLLRGAGYSLAGAGDGTPTCWAGTRIDQVWHRGWGVEERGQGACSTSGYAVLQEPPSLLPAPCGGGVRPADHLPVWCALPLGGATVPGG